MLTAITDLRGEGRWLATDYARKADLMIVGASWKFKPIPIVRTFAQVSATYLTLDGNVSGEPGSLNKAIGTTLPALKSAPPLWTSGDGRQTLVPLDLTQRFAASELADLCASHLSAFDGVNIDYYGFGWAYPTQYPAEFWTKFDGALRAWVEKMRTLRPAWAFTGQMHQLTEPTGALNGLYLEQYPTAFGQTFESHAADIARLNALLAMQKRAPCWIAELREPGRFPTWYVEKFKQWCQDNGAHASIGRDATAVGA